MSIMCVRISEELYSPSIGEELANDGKPHASEPPCGDLGASHLYLHTLIAAKEPAVNVTP